MGKFLSEHWDVLVGIVVLLGGAAWVFRANNRDLERIRAEELRNPRGADSGSD